MGPKNVNMVWFVLTFLFCTTGSAIILVYVKERSLLWLFIGTAMAMSLFWYLTYGRRKKR